MSDDERELRWLRRVRDLSHQLAVEGDLGKLLPAILDAAIELTGAERGFLVVIKRRKVTGGHKIKVEEARGFDKVALQSPRSSLSRTVLRRVLDEDRGLVTTREEDAEFLGVSSVRLRKVLSIICVPMRLRGELRGALYLDHRFSEQVFSEQDLKILQIFADQAALALESAQLRSGARDAVERLNDSMAQLETLRALRRPEEGSQGAPIEAALAPGFVFGELVGASACMEILYEQLERASRSSDPVLICGEVGVGKRLVGREIHSRSERSASPLIEVGCGSLSEAQLASELFGHVQGAFPAAKADRDGAFLKAANGTLLLTQVGLAGPEVQTGLLRVFQERAVRQVGGCEDCPVSCRVVVTAGQSLWELVCGGAFREDLYYRLEVLRVNVPPLRRRAQDVSALFAHFARAQRTRLELSAEALERLANYSWPGNVRELESEVRRLGALRTTKVTTRHLSSAIVDGRGVAQGAGGTSGKTLEQVEREMIESAMRSCRGNKAKAARQLGVPRSTLYGLLERFDLR